MSEHLVRYHRYLSNAKKLRSQSAELQARALVEEANADAAYADHLTEQQLIQIEAEECARRG